MNENELPETLQAVILYFGHEEHGPDRCFQFFVGMRWPNGVACPRCGCMSVGFIKTRRRWNCKGCKKQFSVKVGTPLENSPLGLDKWACAIWMIANAKNGISSYEIHRALGITQKSAWFMLQRIRLMMKTGTMETLSGTVEADETYVGGKAKNMHKSRKKGMKRGRGATNKTIVLGMLERKGKAVVKVVPNVKAKTLQPEVRQHVLEGSELFTDALQSYTGLDAEYAHEVIDHAEAYVRGKVHTNGLENFWSLLKRTILGTYVSVMPVHLERYLDEQSFRFNERTDDDKGRFIKVVKRMNGRRLTYKELTGYLS